MDTKHLGLTPPILLIFVFLFSCGDSVETKLIVDWQGTDGSIILDKDGSWVFTIGDFVLPTPEEGIIVENMIWAVNGTQDPVHLDCIVYLRQIESGMKRRLILPRILHF